MRGLIAHLLSCSIISRGWHLRYFRINSGKPSSKMLPDLGGGEFVWSLVLQVFCQFWKCCAIFFFFFCCSLTDPIFSITLLLLLLAHIYNFWFNFARLLASSGNQLCLIKMKTWLVCFIFLLLFFLNMKHDDLLKFSPKSFHRNMWKISQELTRSLVSNYIKYLYEQLKVSSESLCLPYVFFWLPLIKKISVLKIKSSL